MSDRLKGNLLVSLIFAEILILLIGAYFIIFNDSSHNEQSYIESVQDSYSLEMKEVEMDSSKFEKIVKKLIVDYVNSLPAMSGKAGISEDDVYIVWSCKTLQNNKVLASTTLFDGKYYEITYNGDKKEVYFDVYEWLLNKCISLKEE